MPDAVTLPHVMSLNCTGCLPRVFECDPELLRLHSTLRLARDIIVAGRLRGCTLVSAAVVASWRVDSVMLYDDTLLAPQSSNMAPIPIESIKVCCVECVWLIGATAMEYRTNMLLICSHDGLLWYCYLM